MSRRKVFNRTPRVDLPGALPGEPPTPAILEPADVEYEETRTVVAILGGAARRGCWEPPARLRVFALMGGVELDFSDAVLLEGETVIEVYTLMGGVNILAPPDVDVETHGIGLLGGFSSVTHRADESDAPLLTIKGFAIMGGVETKIKKLSWKKRLTFGG